MAAYCNQKSNPCTPLACCILQQNFNSRAKCVDDLKVYGRKVRSQFRHRPIALISGITHWTQWDGIGVKRLVSAYFHLSVDRRFVVDTRQRCRTLICGINCPLLMVLDEYIEYATDLSGLGYSTRNVRSAS